MPNWRFLVVRHFGGSHQRRQTCLQIKQQVEKRGLSSLMPLVKYEPGRGGEYYLGVAVDVDARSDGTDAESTARVVLTEAGVSAAGNPQFSPLVNADQVQSLLRGTLECESFTIPIAYEAAVDGKAPATDRLMSELDLGDLHALNTDKSETEKYNRLLYWCSAIGSGELGRIQMACQLLGISNEWGGAWSVLRRLVLLGHLEFDGGAALRWGVTPPTLVTAASGEYKVLVGQRTPAFTKDLRTSHELVEDPQSNGPSCLVLESSATEIAYRLGQQILDVGCVSRRMGDLLPTIGEWSKRLPTWDERDFSRFQTEQYDPHADVFNVIAALNGQPPAGLYRFTFDQGTQKNVTLAFFDEEYSRWICGDYYGLRFVARSRCRLSRVVHREVTHQLIMPTSDRWPMPYERALVLASGMLPQRLQPEAGPPVFAYQEVPADLAARMCDLLGLEMERA